MAPALLLLSRAAITNLWRAVLAFLCLVLPLVEDCAHLCHSRCDEARVCSACSMSFWSICPSMTH